MSDTIYIVDAYSQIYRGFHAVQGLSTSDGRPSNAIFATGRFLVTLEKEYSPDIGAFAFDLGKNGAPHRPGPGIQSEPPRDGLRSLGRNSRSSGS